VIDPVTFADRKARQLPVLIRVLLLKRGELDLGFLRDEPVSAAMAWLMSLPGVGAKAAAAALNFSTLDRPVLVVDTHVARVARRLGLTGRGDAQDAYERLMSEVPADWTAADLRELHSLMKAHGQSLCDHFEPACHHCALRADCARVGVGASGQVVAFRDRPRSP
jgi:endonuclease-3